MKRIVLTIGLVLCTGIFISTRAQDEEAMKKWMDYATPGEMHKMLASWSGAWKADMKMWMAEGAEVTTTTGTAVNTMIMGGRYQLSNYTAEMMGQPFEGMSTMGYDNLKKTFEATWVDNMGTGTLLMKGKWDPATKSITLEGNTVNPMTGKESALKEVFKIVDENTQIMEMYGPDPQTGKQYKSMEIKYTRVK